MREVTPEDVVALIDEYLEKRRRQLVSSMDDRATFAHRPTSVL